MTHRTLQVAAAVLAAWPAVSAAQDVSVNYDKTYNFANIKSFTVLVPEHGKDPFLERHFVDTVTQAFGAKGWVPADAAAANATVVLHGQSETRQRLDAYSTGGWRWGGGMGSAQLTDYKVGTLVIDIFDTKTKTLLFRGAAGDEMADKAEKNEKKVDKAVSKILKNFPPGSRK